MNNNSFIKNFIECARHIQNTALNIYSIIGCAVLLLCFSNVSEAQFLFGPDNFTIVDTNSKGGFSDLGSVGSNGEHQYRLTEQGLDYVNSATAIWHKKKISLQQNFEFVFKVRFGEFLGGADGMTFVLHNSSASHHVLIGDNGGYLGYGVSSYTPGAYPNPGNIIFPRSINPSFAIEFDTYVGTADPYDSVNYIYSDHISYLMNSNVTSTIRNSTPITSNATVKDGIWHCVKIVWEKTNSGDYSMITYFDGTLKMQRAFATISDLVTGATDSVWWGLTAGCGSRTNTHDIELVNIVNCNIFSPKTIVIEGEGIPSDTLYLGGSDTVETACGIITFPGNDIGTTPNNPITYDKVHCHNKFNELKIFALEGIDTTSARWEFKKGDSWDSVGSGSKFLTANMLDSIPKNTDTIRIRLISGTDTIYFNIKYPKEKTALKDHFRDSVFKNTGYTDYPITTSGMQAIKLPTLDSGCSYFFL